MLPTERGPPGTDHDTTPEPVLVHEETEAVMSPGLPVGDTTVIERGSAS